mmetsp:Transcript_44893/g.66007  ORF Transcript_44893/g.66007 Transcript_44893/m.66007 type:complete len:447 (-) Transcript_44893:5-1345(-)
MAALQQNPDQHYLSERDRLMGEIEETEQERIKLERENAKAQAELNISDEQLETLLARVDFKLIQQQIMDLMKQKSELETKAEETQQKIKSAQAEESYAVAKHQELVQNFQQLKTALDYSNAEAKAKVDALQAQYDEQKQALEQLQIQEESEYKKKTAEMAKKLAPECKKRIQRAVIEERKKTKQQLVLLEQKAQMKFEAAAKITCNKYAQECKNTVNALMKKKEEQEKVAEKLLRDINTAKDILLKNLRDNAESFEDEKLLGERDDALDAHLDTLKTECHRLWEKLDIEPERIISFLEKVVEVSPKCRGFYHFLYNEARHLISTLLIKEAITHREAVRKIANVAKYKTLEMRQTLETTIADINKVDNYVSLQIFPHIQHQFQILVEDVDKISKTIMGYLQEYQMAFGRTYLHEGTPYIERILKDRAEFSTALRKVMFPLQLPQCRQ